VPFQPSQAIRILEVEANKRGDLFSRLVGDLFLALGYGPPRFNVHKSGRELDIVTTHRMEQRLAIAECKAHDGKIGGDEINKFIGALDVERRKTGMSVIGYFVSLSGFTETAIEQEKGVEPPRVVLLDGGHFRTELSRGRIVCSEESAIALAARCVQQLPPDVHLHEPPDLLGHALGWIWCVYFSDHGQIRYFTLIHADGYQLSATLSQEVISADTQIGGHLRELQFLGPAATAVQKAATEDAKVKYFEYLALDFGAIELSGLPTDQDVGSRRFLLESLFVPPHLTAIPKSDTSWLTTDYDHIIYHYAYSPTEFSLKSSSVHWSPQSHLTPLSDLPYIAPKSSREEPSREELLTTAMIGAGVDFRGKFGNIHRAAVLTGGDYNDLISKSLNAERLSVGEVLAKDFRIAVLGEPGAGKSTLLKRLATAYAFPKRHVAVDDKLPVREFLPIIIRCRQLGDSISRPIWELIRTLATRSEMEEALHAGFYSLLRESLRNGSALLLIDGLDEISDEGARVAFAQQLRLFLATYPAVSLVVTSREPGFRKVAPTLQSICREYRVAQFDNDDIVSLTVAWHREVLGERGSVIAEARSLAELICSTDRVRRLARNPLLLTTLLLVKRWVGRLPNRRSVLYGKAIEVLLMTWNVEGHAPLEQEEIVPQLAYVAHSMMEEDRKRVSADWLRSCLTAARRDMPEVLSFAKLSIPEFLQRVESRSSLLVMSGHEVEDGKLVSQYEFRHLTFQEYLAATAVVEGYYHGRGEDDSIVTALEPHLADQAWQEVVALSAVLAGRRVRPLAEYLLTKSREDAPDGSADKASIILGQCIVDDCLLSPELAREVLREIVRHSFHCRDVIAEISRGKYLETFDELLKSTLSGESTGLFAAEYALAVFLDARCQAPPATTDDGIEFTRGLLNSDDAWQHVHGALRVLMFGEAVATAQDSSAAKHLSTLGDLVAQQVGHFSSASDTAAAWTLAWLGHWRLWSPIRRPLVIEALARMLVERPEDDAKYAAAWALSRLEIIRGDQMPDDVELLDTAAKTAEGLRNRRPVYFEVAAFVLKFYRRPEHSRVRVKHRMKVYFSGNERMIAYAWHLFPKTKSNRPEYRVFWQKRRGG
jgi:hypothetical protein